MRNRQRQLLYLFALVVSLTLLAAPARGASWFSLHIGSHGTGLAIGTFDWWPYGAAWHDAGWTGSYDIALAGHGEWLRIDGISRVWRPSVAASWRPFTHGRWVVTNLGWTWVSYEPWGYFPHHYGHWAYSIHGWLWVPGYSYQPANVVWVRGGAYVGWYPCPPPGWSHASHGHGHGYRAGHHHDYGRGHDDGWRDAQYATYVNWKHLGSHDISAHALSAPAVRSRAGDRAPMTTGHAPRRSDVRRRGADMVPTVGLEQRSIFVGDRRVTVSRPQGMEASILRHGRNTIDQAPFPEVTRRLTGGDATRRQNTFASRDAPPYQNGSRSVHRHSPSTPEAEGYSEEHRPSTPQSSRSLVRSQLQTAERAARAPSGEPLRRSSETAATTRRPDPPTRIPRHTGESERNHRRQIRPSRDHVGRSPKTSKQETPSTHTTRRR